MYVGIVYSKLTFYIVEFIIMSFKMQESLKNARKYTKNKEEFRVLR